MLTRAILFVALMVATVLPAAAAQAERRIALVVGNSAYANASALRNPKNDASDMAAELKKVGFEVLLGLDLDQQGFARLIEQYARRLEGADVGVFFYAGHGLQIDQKNYLVSVNAKLENEFLVSSEAIDLESVVRLMESKTPVNLIFVDACRDDPLAENLRRNLVAMKRSVALGRGLARIEPSGRDTLVAYAAAPGQEAADGRDRNSPFTGALLKHLPTPGLEVSVMLKQVTADVRRDTNNAQRPQQLSDMSRTFYFVPPDTTVATAATGAQKVEMKTPALPSMPGVDNHALEIAFWTAAQASNECEAMQDYIRRFPNGNFVTLARLSERHLCDPGRRIHIVTAPSAAAAATVPAPAPALVAEPPAPVTAAVPPAPTPAAEPLLPAAPPAQQQTATLQPQDAAAALPAPDAANGAPDGNIAQAIQLQLVRLGCARGTIDGQWQASTQAALRAFNSGVGMSLATDRPTPETLEALSHFPDRTCVTERPAAKPQRAARKPDADTKRPRREKATHEKATHEARRPPARERVERVERVEREYPQPYPRERAERWYPRPFLRGRAAIIAPPPPMPRVQQQAPAVCEMDEGYGRTKRCDAGR